MLTLVLACIWSGPSPFQLQSLIIFQRESTYLSTVRGSSRESLGLHGMTNYGAGRNI